MRPIPNRDGAIPDHTSLRATLAGHTNRRPSLAAIPAAAPSRTAVAWATTPAAAGASVAILDREDRRPLSVRSTSHR